MSTLPQLSDFDFKREKAIIEAKEEKERKEREAAQAQIIWRGKSEICNVRKYRTWYAYRACFHCYQNARLES